MSQAVVIKVRMSCEGCVEVVKTALKTMEGVESLDIDMKEQKVTVKGNVKADDVLQSVSNTGKKATLWEAAPEAPAEAETEPRSPETAAGA